jgi:hypothetical protein
MKQTSRYRLIPAALVGLLVAGLSVAFAQSATSTASASASAPVGNPVDAVTPQQMRTQAQTFLPQMDQSAQTVRRQLEQSRESRDVVKVLCLNDKLNQIDVAMQSATERRHALDLASKQGDTDLANHEYTILSVLYQRVQQLDSEANQCIGKEVAFTGESSVTVIHEGELPVEDPSDYPGNATIVQPPSCASCFR